MDEFDEFADAESRALTIALVARDGHQMKLKPQEQIAAIREMARLQVSIVQMAHRLKITQETVRRTARRYQIEMPRAIPAQDWWVEVATPSASTTSRRRQKAEQREREAARCQG